MSADQLDLFPEKVRAYRHSPMHDMMRREIRDHKRSGRPVYSPRNCKRRLLELLADGEYRLWHDICQILDMGPMCTIWRIEAMERLGIIECKPHYYGDHLDPWERPPERDAYRGFQYAYRLKRETST